MVTFCKGLANKWMVLALFLAALGAALAFTLLTAGAQSNGISYAENGTGPVADFTAVDPEGTSVTTKWTVITGDTVSALLGLDPPGITGIAATDAADSSLFKISSAGVLEFNDSPDYEDDERLGATAVIRNTYKLVLAAKVGSKTSYEKVVVNVTNEDETATTGIDLSLIQPREGSRIRAIFADSVGNPFVGADGADLTPTVPPTGASPSGIVDPDGDKDIALANAANFQQISADNVDWQWYRVTSRTAPIREEDKIDDATSPIYAVQDDDNHKYLRVTATYEDTEGEGKVLKATSLYTTLPLWTDSVSPKFSDNNLATPDPINLRDALIDDNDGEETNVGTYTASHQTSHPATGRERLTYSLIPADNSTAGTNGYNNTNFRAADLDLFQINRETGQVTVAKGKTLHDSADLSAAITEASREQSTGFVVRIKAVDGYEAAGVPNFGTGDLTITVEDEDEAPVFTDAGGEKAHTFAENTNVSTELHTFAAYDPETSGAIGSGVTYALSGADADKFNTENFSTTGTLLFAASPNFEKAADANKDNIYEITVKASATSPGEGATSKSDSIDVTVTVTNVDEPGEVTLDARNPRIGVAISARVVSDADGGVRDITWQWERDGATTPSGSCEAAVTAGNWTDATGKGANTATYTPNSADDGRCLQARASYTDNAGPGAETAEQPDALVVKARNLAPEFEDDTKTMYYVQENPSARTAVRADDDGTTASTANPNVDLVRASDGQDADENDGPIDYNLLNTPDAVYFVIDSEGDTVGDDTIAAAGAGQIRVSSAGASGTGKLDYEARRTYMVTVEAVDREGLRSTLDVTIKVTDEDESPKIMQGKLAVAGPPLKSYTSGGTGDVATYTAVGVSSDGATWTLTGDDAADFNISTGGVLTFNTPPSTGSPADANKDNIYMVTVEATSSDKTETASKAVTVTVGAAATPGTMTPIGDYTNKQRFDLDNDGKVEASEIQQAIIIWIQDNPEP